MKTVTPWTNLLHLIWQRIHHDPASFAFGIVMIAMSFAAPPALRLLAHVSGWMLLFLGTVLVIAGMSRKVRLLLRR